ncbi:hypothetical protein KKA14_20350 [bacterium]|nr:hypothetical protein [bacterium]
MKFNLLLFILYRKLIKASKKDASFKKFIKDKLLKVSVKTADGNKGRMYVFDKGRISSIRGSRNESDAAMVWSDADTAFKVMSSTNDEASVAALTEKKLEIEGDFKEFMWFTRALDIMMGKA